MKKLKLSRRTLLKSAGGGVAAALTIPVVANPKAHTSSERELSSGWQFRQAGEGSWLEAGVPGTVHTDLLRNGKIPDPFYRTNERDLQWIDKKDWEYRKTVLIDPETLAHEHVELQFDGLDTYADVYFNDILVLRADNMFREWTVDVKKHARPGPNQLRVHFDSPIRKGLEALAAFGMPLPANNDQSENGGLGDKKVSPFTRKAGYHYGWDWGPRFVTSGIWRPVRLRAWSGARLLDLHIVQDKLSRDAAVLTAKFEIVADSAGKAVVEISSPVDARIKRSRTVELKRGLNEISLPFDIENPRLWWTNGLGEAFLYPLTGSITTSSGAKDSRDSKIGLRTLRLVQRPDKDGATFYFELNGVPVFAKGANWIPNDSFLPRVSRQKYEHLVGSAAQCHMNILRVWGGGVYEDDHFYDLCDRSGILVWQEFMFTCAMFPDGEAFLDNVRQEAIQNVRRLRNHPCLALWCGNNEIDTAWQWDVPTGGWGWKQAYTPAQQARLTHAYDAIFHDVLPKAVAEHDPQRAYWPSSPLAAWDGHNKVVHADVKLPKQSGDIHYWDVWWGQKPFEEYRHAIGRFMTEYGFQSFPEFKTVEAYARPGDYDIFSEVMKAHQRSSIGNGTIKAYMERDYRVPSDFREFLYLGQVLQAKGIKIAMEAHRARMPYCMGSLFWQINDCWPVASWSSIDYFGRWKAQQYFARKAYAPVLVSPVLENDKVSVAAVSDRLVETPVTLLVKVMDFSGKVLTQHRKALVLPANNSSVVFSGDVPALLNGAPKTGVLMLAQLLDGSTVLSQNILYFARVKDLTLPRSQVSTNVRKLADGTLSISLSSPTLVKNLYLTTEKADGTFTDNYFDLLPGETAVVEFKPSAPLSAAQLKVDLQLFHIAEIGVQREAAV